MKIFGLTGGIGSGKSTVAGMLRARGVPVLDADQFARSVVEPGSAGLAEIAATFGPEVLTPNGALDRAKMGAIVFANPDRRRDLEQIIHPRVRAAMAEAIASYAAQGAPVAFMDIPLLFESRDPSDFVGVVVVYVPPQTQLQRVMARDGLSAEAAQARINAQLPIDEKARRANWVIDNQGDLAFTEAQVDLLLGRLQHEGST